MAPADGNVWNSQFSGQRPDQPADRLWPTADDRPDATLQQSTGDLGTIEGVSRFHKVAADVQSTARQETIAVDAVDSRQQRILQLLVANLKNGP